MPLLSRHLAHTSGSPAPRSHAPCALAAAQGKLPSGKPVQAASMEPLPPGIDHASLAPWGGSTGLPGGLPEIGSLLHSGSGWLSADEAGALGTVHSQPMPAAPLPDDVWPTTLDICYAADVLPRQLDSVASGHGDFGSLFCLPSGMPGTNRDLREPVAHTCDKNQRHRAVASYSGSAEAPSNPEPTLLSATGPGASGLFPGPEYSCRGNHPRVRAGSFLRAATRYQAEEEEAAMEMGQELILHTGRDGFSVRDRFEAAPHPMSDMFRFPASNAGNTGPATVQSNSPVKASPVSRRRARQSSGNSGAATPSSGARKKRFSKRAVGMLRSWLADNVDHPYPSEEVKRASPPSCSLHLPSLVIISIFCAGPR